MSVMACQLGAVACGNDRYQLALCSVPGRHGPRHAGLARYKLRMRWLCLVPLHMQDVIEPGSIVQCARAARQALHCWFCCSVTLTYNADSATRELLHTMSATNLHAHARQARTNRASRTALHPSKQTNWQGGPSTPPAPTAPLSTEKTAGFHSRSSSTQPLAALAACTLPSAQCTGHRHTFHCKASICKRPSRQ
jgi:hypothetical protein